MIKDLLSEIAMKCGDDNFKDFQESQYLRALHRANRQVAKLYAIDERILEFTVSEYASDNSSDIVLDLPDFKAVVDVWVNGKRLYKTDGTIDDHYQYAYYARWIGEELHFNYVKGYSAVPGMDISNLDITEVMSTGITERSSVTEETNWRRSADDEVVIRYYCMPNYETTQSGEFVIPTEYEEEQIAFALVEMAELGVAKYISGDKNYKWLTLYKMFKKRKGEYDQRLVKDQEWVKIQPFKYP